MSAALRVLDTQYSFYGGEWKSLENCSRSRAAAACATCASPAGAVGAKACLSLLEALCDAAFEVSLETSGALDVEPVDPRVSRVVDLKTPDSGEARRNRLDNLDMLRGRDQVKLVLCSRADYEWARDLLRSRPQPLPCQVLFSPVWGRLEPRELAEWILEDRLDVRLQLQLHKLLWGDQPGK